MSEVKGARRLRMPFLSFLFFFSFFFFVFFFWTEEPQTGNAGRARSRGKNMKDRGPKAAREAACVVKLKFERQTLPAKIEFR